MLLEEPSLILCSVVSGPMNNLLECFQDAFKVRVYDEGSPHLISLIGEFEFFARLRHRIYCRIEVLAGAEL